MGRCRNNSKPRAATILRAFSHLSVIAEKRAQPYQALGKLRESQLTHRFR